jgi:signal peptidase I
LLVAVFQHASLLLTGISVVVLFVAMRIVEISWAYRLARQNALKYERVWYNRVIVYVAYAAAVTLLGDFHTRLIRSEIIEPFRILSSSMAPTLLPGDQLYAVKRGPLSQWDRGDVIVWGDSTGKAFASRVMALGGDTIDITRQQVFVNGQPLPQTPCNSPEPLPSALVAEDFAATSGSVTCIRELSARGKEYHIIHRADVERRHRSFQRVVVRPHHLFIMGDNRDNAADSRGYGDISEELVIGRAVEIWLSFLPEEGIRWARMGKTL